MNTKPFGSVKAEVQSALGAAKKEVLRNTVDKTFGNVIPEGFEVTEEGVQDSCKQFYKSMLMLLVAAGPLDFISKLKFNKWSRLTQLQTT